MKTYDVFGLKINDYSLKELLSGAQSAVSTPGLTVISWITTNMLLTISDNREQREWIEDIDMTVPIYPELLKGEKTVREIHGDGKLADFVETYFKYISATSTSMAIVADSKQRMESLRKWLKSKNRAFKDFKEFIIEDLIYEDTLFNDLNCEMPKVVISCLPWEMQGPLTVMAHRVSNASIWISLVPDVFIGNESRASQRKVYMEQAIFNRKLSAYRKMHKEKTENSSKISKKKTPKRR